MRFRPNPDVLEDRRLMSFGGGNIDTSIPRFPSTSPGLNFTSNSFHNINATVPAVASAIAQNPSSADAKLATYVTNIPNGVMNLLPILETDVTTFENGGNPAPPAPMPTSAQANTTITTLFMDLLDRAPDSAELTSGTQALQTGVSVQVVANTIVQSSEFLTDNTMTGATADANNTQFVTALYTDVLGRSPDSPGLASWVNALDTNAMTTQQVANAFIFSPEAATSSTSIFAEVQTAQANTSITSLFMTLLDRAPTSAELTSGTQALQTGVSVQMVANTIVQSSEFLTDNTTSGATADANNTQFVTALYTDVLGRAPDSPGLASWVNALDTNAMTTNEVANDFIFSSEAMTSSTSVLQVAAIPFIPTSSTPTGTKFFFGTVVPNGTITGNFPGTSQQAQLSNLIQQDTLAYLADGIGNSFNILKSNVGWASDNLLTFNGRV
jgi:Domain of unknown function (DUF4214)